MSWDGCKDQLDPAWNPQTDQDTITTATPEYDQPAGLVTSKDDE